CRWPIPAIVTGSIPCWPMKSPVWFVVSTISPWFVLWFRWAKATLWLATLSVFIDAIASFRRGIMHKKTLFQLTLAASLLVSGVAAAQTTLNIGLQDDPDLLDPARARTFVGRIVFASLCDKLVDITPDLDIVPQLATAWEWQDDKTLKMTLRDKVVYHDGTPMDAASVKANLDRAKTLPDSNRKSELATLERVEA